MLLFLPFQALADLLSLFNSISVGREQEKAEKNYMCIYIHIRI